MKTLIIGDLHFKKIDSKIEQEYRHRVLKEVSKIIKKNKIKRVLQMGDLFDTRRTLDISVIDETRAIIEKYFKGVHITTLAGNHDTYYKNNNKVCSTASIFKNDKNITIITEPTETEFGLILPWINKENYDRTFEMIEKSTSDYCFGHLEINGFAKVRGFNENKGLIPSLFKKFKKTISGHFHLVQEEKNILYIGSLFQNDFNDVGDIKRVLILDKKLTNIDIPIEFFKRIIITDKMLKSKIDVVKEYDLNICRFELILNCKKSIERESFLDDIYESLEHSEFKTIDNSELLEEEVEISLSENVNDMSLSYVDTCDIIDNEKQALKDLFIEMKENMK